MVIGYSFSDRHINEAHPTGCAIRRERCASSTLNAAMAARAMADSASGASTRPRYRPFARN
jgi:hypothetical protein